MFLCYDYIKHCPCALFIPGECVKTSKQQHKQAQTNALAQWAHNAKRHWPRRWAGQNSSDHARKHPSTMTRCASSISSNIYGKGFDTRSKDYKSSTQIYMYDSMLHGVPCKGCWWNMQWLISISSHDIEHGAHHWRHAWKWSHLYIMVDYPQAEHVHIYIKYTTCVLIVYLMYTVLHMPVIRYFMYATEQPL